MNARTSPWLLAAGACLLVAGGLSASGDWPAPSPPPPRQNPPALTASRPSPHFFPGRILRAKTADIAEAPVPAPDHHSEQTPPPQLDEPLAQARPTLETRASPHFFLGHARLQMPIRPTRGADIPVCHDLPQPAPIDSTAIAASELPKPAANAHSEPAKPSVALEPPKATVAIVAEPIESPAKLLPPQPPAQTPLAPPQSAAARPTPAQRTFSLASLALRQPTEKQPTEKTSLVKRLTEKPAPTVSLKPAAVQPVAAQQTALVQERLARLAGSSTPLQPAEVFSVPRPDFFADEIELTGLQARLPQAGSSSSGSSPQPSSPAQAGSLPPPAAALHPAAITPAVASSELIEPKLRLAVLQQPLPRPAAPLQPAEVLPIPTPYSPAAPRIPALDQDRPIAAVGTNIEPTSGRLPTDIAVERFQGDYPPWATRGYSDVAYYWDAPALCYGPLRFEEVNLERYGYGCSPVLQPFVSAAHFAGATLALPYNMVNRPCWECIAPLGHYRPGSPVPYRKIWPEWNPLAAAAEVGTIAGLILLIP